VNVLPNKNCPLQKSVITLLRFVSEITIKSPILFLPELLSWYQYKIFNYDSKKSSSLFAVSSEQWVTDEPGQIRSDV
jgi:hypothetical protein